MCKTGPSKEQPVAKTRARAKANKDGRSPKAKIVIDPLTGIPALTLGPNAPILTSKEVEEMLADFP